MFRIFQNCLKALDENGRLVVVFANKQPSAWETLVSAFIRAGFVVDGFWPIQTEMQNKVAGGACLSSSIWLVCKKRSATRLDLLARDTRTAPTEVRATTAEAPRPRKRKAAGRKGTGRKGAGRWKGAPPPGAMPGSSPGTAAAPATSASRRRRAAPRR